MLHGLRCLAWTYQHRQLPLLQRHMCGARRALNPSRGKDRALQALWCTQWQGVLRSAELIRDPARAGLAWSAARDTHRSRLRAEAVQGQGPAAGLRLTLSLKQTKTDQAGTRGWSNVFREDRTDGEIPVGTALVYMIKGDPASVPDVVCRCSATQRPDRCPPTRPSPDALPSRSPTPGSES